VQQQLHPKAKEANMKRDVYQEVTDRIIRALEQGVRPWSKPWSGGNMEGRIILPRRHNGMAYRGVNILTLWIAAEDKGYRAPVWMTFKQAHDLGGAVRKGEKGSVTVYADSLTRSEPDSATGEDATREIHYLKTYYVFNVEQIDGLPPQYYPKPEPLPVSSVPRIAHAEAFFAATGADIRTGGNQAYYVPSADFVQMPPFEAFRDAESYYAVLAHECTHWTRAGKRLDRSFGQKRFGDEGYAMEELVAELGAAFVCAGLDLTTEPREDHASYIEHWLKVLKSDKRAIFTASSYAQKAADYLHSLQPAAAQEVAA
jgi:antirestriction protein ArdC